MNGSHQLNSTSESSIGKYRLSLPAECYVVAHPELPTAIDELLTNAVEHNPPDVSITVRVQQTTGGTLEVKFVDTGVGIPETERETITRPRETPLSHCEGLGLWLVYWIVQQSEGKFTIETRESGGTRIQLTLPAAPSQ
ncbi:ATP-binding protein [Halarchaeum salinum]|uniref:histidine kinase n=1 Tax=Halarchaeum salinum TaxID=489912 RepID=A0AAV3SAN1_9EURY